MLLVSFYTPCKQQKPRRFIFLASIERGPRREMGNLVPRLVTFSQACPYKYTTCIPSGNDFSTWNMRGVFVG